MLGPLLAVILFAGAAGYAYAHYVYEEGIVWNHNNERCLTLRSEISHGSGGYSKVTALTKTTTAVLCLGSWDRLAGRLGA